jgi:hypothetical protein
MKLFGGTCWLSLQGERILFRLVLKRLRGENASMVGGGYKEYSQSELRDWRRGQFLSRDIVRSELGMRQMALLNFTNIYPVDGGRNFLRSVRTI